MRSGVRLGGSVDDKIRLKGESRDHDAKTAIADVFCTERRLAHKEEREKKAAQQLLLEGAHERKGERQEERRRWEGNHSKTQVHSLSTGEPEHTKMHLWSSF